MHYHLIGVCGTAMASLAGMLQARGHLVTGSDQNVYPPMSTQLEALGIKASQGYRAENLNFASGAPGCVVVGNAISRGNPEVEATLNRKLTYRSMAEVVKEEFIRGRRSLVITGTHGKTTTTSLAAWVMECAGLNPTFLVGGVVQNFGASFRVAAESDYFIIEGDEYDTAYFDKGAKFMHYLPEIGVVNNIEFDHADIYADLDAIKLSFKRFMNLIPSNGRLIANGDDRNVRDVIASFGGNLHTQVETFGAGENCKWRLHDIETGEMTKFRVSLDGRDWGAFRTPLVGEFNARNCLAAIIAADAWGARRETIAEALESFKSVKRRAEVKGEAAGVTIIDDFAHHPTAVRETLKALRAKYKGRRLVAIFEPRSFTSRQAVFQAQYVEAFAHADYVVIAGVFNAQKKATHAIKSFDLLDTEELSREISENGRAPAVTLPDTDAIIAHLSPQLRAGDVVAVMSNGGFDDIHNKLLTNLGKENDE